MAEIGVIGSGSWGTALALVLNKKRTSCNHLVLFKRRSR